MTHTLTELFDRVQSSKGKAADISNVQGTYSSFLVRDRKSGELYSPQVEFFRVLRENADVFIRLKYR